jgi:hypothetical protein
VQKSKDRKMESLIYIANCMYLLAYLVNDMLRLRILTIIATSSLIVYFSMRPEPMATIICWNLFFATLNAGQVLWLVMKKRNSNIATHIIGKVREHVLLIAQSLPIADRQH